MHYIAARMLSTTLNGVLHKNYCRELEGTFA